MSSAGQAAESHVAIPPSPLPVSPQPWGQAPGVWPQGEEGPPSSSDLDGATFTQEIPVQARTEAVTGWQCSLLFGKDPGYMRSSGHSLPPTSDLIRSWVCSEWAGAGWLAFIPPLRLAVILRVGSPLPPLSAPKAL